MGKATKKPEVIIIGAGVAGLSAAFHLRKRFGINQILLFDASGTSATADAAGWVVGGQVDNFTRLSHAHGSAAATSLWRFGSLAFAKTMDFAEQIGFDHLRGSRERLVVSEHEMAEAQRAEQELQENGFKVSLTQGNTATFLTSRVLARQLEGDEGGFIEPLSLLAALEAQAELHIEKSQIVKLRENGHQMEVIDSKGNCYQSELIVVTCHLGARKLLPGIAEAFVPIAEQWIEVELEKPVNIGAGYAFSAHHGYEWGVFTHERVCRIGGGRFLRKLAGIGWETAPVEERITKFLCKQLEMTFAELKIKKILRTVAGLDCRPCDELPIVGPMFGNSRVLIAGGFMSLGLTQGFLAGQCLAELIANGQAPELPRLIYPERLRSL